MTGLIIVLSITAAACLLILLIAYICFYMAFYVPRRKSNTNEFSILDGEIYQPYKETMNNWMKEVRAMPKKEIKIISFDGLTLTGKYYEYKKGAPIELMFHGYRGNAERDLCGGVQRCFLLGRSALIVDQRACGNSQGKIITFGVNESKDCFSWINYIISTFGNDTKIILTGISMGAATVCMAAGNALPENVIGVLADCGYTGAKEIIKKVIKDMKLPANILYPFVKLGAKLYGKFNLEENPPVKALKNCKIPVIFIHGESDDFVPCQMSKENFNACASKKELLTVKGAGHGLSYLIEPEKYLNALENFFDYIKN